MLKKFIEFMEDHTAPEMYITGVAGTGKTTELKTLVDYCMEEEITSVTCAYTHKAVRVLRSKLSTPTDTNVLATLHSYLKKRPTINDQAVEVKHVDGNTQMAIPAHVQVVFIDEFSMVGKKDYVSILDLQYKDYEDGSGKELVTKVVYIGDPNQLPPVKDEQIVMPRGPYHVHLTKIYRQAGDNPLIDTLIDLNSYISGEPAMPLGEHDTLIRGQDIVELYKRNKSSSKVMLAYTNQQVQYLNAEVQGYKVPIVGDTMFSPTVREIYTLDEVLKQADNIISISGDILELDSKYKTLETLHDIEGIKFYTVTDMDMNVSQRAVVFGHFNYLAKSQELAGLAVEANREIEQKFGFDSREWAQNNWSHPLAKRRAKMWKNYLSFKGNVLCMDFPHAMTVHKSQGSTYDFVYLDIHDIGICADKDYNLYLKLLYVGISRASERVYTT